MRGKGSEFAAATFTDQGGELGIVIREEEEGGARSHGLTHEDERDLRRQQQERHRRAQDRLVGEDGKALAEGAVADLIVILQEGDKAARRQVAARRAARPALPGARWLALKDEAVAQSARQRLGGAHRIVPVIAIILAGQQNMQRVMNVIVPLRIEETTQM